jgi:YjbE family integral membrane protein
MDILSFEFLTALLAIVVIDLVLAGDNAIVIALAARSLPPPMRRRAVLWGTVAAIGARSAMTLVVVWLLNIPGLLLAGGALLVWIAYRLLLPENGDAHGPKLDSAPGFWAAIRTIVVADVVMGLDNVLAVAGAAQGSYLLVVLGLLISVPIMVWGSTLILRWVERFPAIVYFGAGVLAWTAATMMVSEPLVKPLLGDNRAAVALIHLVLVGAVVWSGFVANHRRLASRMSARLAALARPPEGESRPAVVTQGEDAMLKVLVPVDASANTAFALRRVASEFASRGGLEVHLLNVQPMLSRHVGQFIGRRTREGYHLEQAEKVLQPARRLLERAGVPCTTHVRVGAKAESITDEARRLRCDRIVMGTARKDSLTRMLEDSTTNQVLERATVPVEVIAGRSVSRLERFGLPMGLGAAMALAVAAAID